MQPVDALTREVLRRAVFGLRQRERGRTFGPRIHVGLPDDRPPGTDATLEGLGDHGLRTEVLARMLRWTPEAGRCGAWLTRNGGADPQDSDAHWHAAARSAFAEAGVELAFFAVVTKQGWHSPATGERVVWRRLRIR